MKLMLDFISNHPTTDYDILETNPNMYIKTPIDKKKMNQDIHHKDFSRAQI